jgi:hypothetical protein
VLITSSRAFNSLSSEQQNVLRDAATATLPGGLADARTEDVAAVTELCTESIALAVASSSDVSELRAAFEPIYQQISSTPASKDYIDKIKDLKAKLAAPAEAPQCLPDNSGAHPSGDFPDGTYDVRGTSDDLSDSCAAEAGLDKSLMPATSHLQATFEAGKVTQFGEVNGVMERGSFGTYTVFRDRIEVTDSVEKFSARWSFDGTNLSFNDFEGAACDVASVWGSHPWVRVR